MWRLPVISYFQSIFKFYIGFAMLTKCSAISQTLDATTMTSFNKTNMDTNVRSFTEKFIEKQTGRKVNMAKLLANYSLICPLDKSCGVAIDNRFLFPREIFSEIEGCNRCTCNPSCVNFGNCCPGTHFGYANYSCVNTSLFPKNSEKAYYMIGTCLDTYYENKTVIELCKDIVEPCTGSESSLIYKNKYCGACNREPGCSTWNIEVECSNVNEFEMKMNSFASLTDMKKALEEDGCRIIYKPKNITLRYQCNDPKNDYLDKILVDKCNVSGLWQKYDEDIDWACENFIIPYKQFKNVFCYICNPSRANKHPAPIVDRCLPTPNDSNLNLIHACKDIPVSDRLLPYKNIYCYKCNRGNNYLLENVKYSLQRIDEDNTLDLQTRLEIVIKFTGEDNVKTYKKLVTDLIATPFERLKNNTGQVHGTKLSYNASDLEQFVNEYNVVCGTGTLCSDDEREFKQFYGNPVCKNCSCDSLCAENENCCPDILFKRRPYSCNSHKTFPEFSKMKATGTQLAQDIGLDIDLIGESYKTIDVCLNADKSSNEALKCSGEKSVPDDIYAIPVSAETGVTYKNIHCFECNNNASSILLQFQVVCRTYIENELFRKIDHMISAIKLYCDEISFVPLKNKKCTDSYDPKKAAIMRGEKFIRRELHPSEFEFQVKTVVKINATEYGKAVKNVFEKCNKTGLYKNWKNDEDLIERVCETDDASLMSLPEYRIEDRVYKNFACFLCNPEYESSSVDFDNVTSQCLSNNSVEWYVADEALEILCNKTETHPRWLPFKNMYCAECNLPPWQLVHVHVQSSLLLPAAPYKYIFTLSPADFKHLDKVLEEESIPKCTKGTYDYALKKCRLLSCNEGFQLFNATCKPVLESVVRDQYSLSLSLYFLSDETRNMSDSTGANVTLSDRDDMTLFVNFQKLCSEVISNITSQFDETTEHYVLETDCSASPCQTLDNNKAYEDRTFVDLVRLNMFHIKFVLLIVKTEAISLVHRALRDALNRQFVISDIQDMNGLQTTTVVYANSDPTKFNSNRATMTVSSPLPTMTECGFFQINNNPLSGDSQPVRYYTIDAFFTCAYVQLHESEVYLDIESNAIFLKHLNVSFSTSEYKIVNSDIIICVDVYEKRTFVETQVILVDRTDHTKSIFIVYSFICTIVSLVCLFLTFATYCFISSLQTTAGKNIMALCVSLFFSQGLLQFGINATKIPPLCVSIGILVHLSWLVSFSAMNISSFHLFKVFKYNRHASNSTDNSLFIKYLLYIICLPFALVLATISISLVRSDGSNLGYGQYYCFISDFYIFIFTFVVPACLIFASNIVFFSIAFHQIKSTPTVQGAHDRNHFYICLRLCTIIGVAWPLIIIDSSLAISWFSFVAAGVNALQGVFIFVSFVLNRRVVGSCLSTLLEKVGEQTNNTVSSGTRSSISSRNYRV